MEKQTREKVVLREHLCNGRTSRRRIVIDMESVYNDIDKGMSLKEVAKKYKVSPTTLQRRHEEHQAELKRRLEKENGNGYELPPLPPGI